MEGQRPLFFLLSQLMKKCQGVYNTKKYIEKHNPVLYKHLIEDFDDNLSWRERILLNKMGLTAPPKCPVCGSPTKFSNEGYRKYCSNKCANRDPDKKQKSVLTNLQKYGVENPMRNEDIKSKAKQTNLQKYGVENPMNLNTIREKLSAAKRTTFLLGDQSGTKSYENVLGYTMDGDWICKCPHPGCDKCEDKTYVISPKMAAWRKKDGIELCTYLLPKQPPFSTFEIKIRRWLTEMDVNYTTNDRRFGQEMDIYIPSLKLAIEVNGCYWHSTQHKTPSYHINKSLLLAEHGIRCVFVWDDYKDEDIESFLRALIEDRDLSPWIEKWFPDINGWPADFGLIDGQWQEHKCFHGGYKYHGAHKVPQLCYDAGVFI